MRIRKQVALFCKCWRLFTWIFALRAVFNVNVRQLAVNERQCFLCGLWCAMFVNGFARSVAVEFVVNGVQGASMDVCFIDWPKWNACIPQRALARSMVDHFLSHAKHAALTGINGSLAEINVGSPACGARSKATIVRKRNGLSCFLMLTKGDLQRFFASTYHKMNKNPYFCTLNKTLVYDKSNNGQ